MGAFEGLVDWLSDPANWSGPEGVPARVGQHVQISGVSVAIATAIALPIGLVIGHTRRFEFLGVSIANLGRAIPSFALLSIAFQIVANTWTGLAFSIVPTVVAMVLLGLPPILTNTYVGVQQVDRDTVEAARGMGMRGRQILGRLELPLAAPLIIAGVRTAAVQIIATATLAAYVGQEGLGRYIRDGFAQSSEGQPMVLAGAILVALLAIVTDLLFGIVERVATPRTSAAGPRRTRRLRPDVENPETALTGTPANP
ncbi:MAG TPA: ABC transporter permease [Actinomycetota bacterium]|nr:ABC transporter permease [Actinomycetota bacterium]